MNRFCTSCGQPVAPEARFCAACGSPVDADTGEPPETPVRTGLAAIAIAGAAAVVVGTLLPWARTFARGHTITESGLDRRAFAAALLALVAGGTAGLHAAGRAQTLGGGTRRPRPVDRAVLLGIAVVSAGALAIAGAGLRDDITAARAANGEASFGPGLLVAAVGVALLLLAGALELATEAPSPPSRLHRLAPIAVVAVAALLAGGIVATHGDDQPGSRARDTAARALERLTALAAEPMRADVAATTDWQQRFNRVLDDIAADGEVQRAFLRLLAAGGTDAHALGSMGRVQLVAATDDTTSLAAALQASGEHGWFWTAVGRLVDRIGTAAGQAFTKVIDELVGHTGVATALAKDPGSPAVTTAVEAAQRGDPLPAASLVDPKLFPPDPQRATTTCSANLDRDSLGRCVPRWEGVWSGRWQGTTTGTTSEGRRNTCNVGGELRVTISKDDGSRAEVRIEFVGGGSRVNVDTCELAPGPNAVVVGSVGHTDTKLQYDDGTVRFSMTKQSVNFADGAASGGGSGVSTTAKVTLARAVSL